MLAEVLGRAEGALISLDATALVALYSDDFIFEDTASGETITDKRKLREYFDRLFALPGVRFSDVRFFRCANLGAGEWTWSGKSLQSGQDYSIRGASLFVLGDNKIEKETVFYDPRTAAT